MTLPIKTCLASVFKQEAWKLTLFTEFDTKEDEEIKERENL